MKKIEMTDAERNSYVQICKSQRSKEDCNLEIWSSFEQASFDATSYRIAIEHPLHDKRWK